MQTGQVLHVLIQRVPEAVQLHGCARVWGWIGDNSTNLISLLAALGACLAAWWTRATQKTMVEVMEREEAQKTPLVEVKTVSIVRTDQKDKDPQETRHSIYWITAHISNTINCNLKTLRYAFFVMDFHSNVVCTSPFGKPLGGEGTHIGNPVIIGASIPLEKSFKDMLFRIAIFCDATDSQGRKHNNQRLYYVINTPNTGGGVEDVSPWYNVHDDQIMAANSRIITWCLDNNYDKSNVDYWPFTDEEMLKSIEAEKHHETKKA